MRAKVTLLTATLLFAVAAHAATDPADRCTAAKIKAAGKKTESKLKCQATAAQRHMSVDQACLMKAEEKFHAAWMKAEAKGGCVHTQDEGAVEASVDACVGNVLAAVSPCGVGPGGVCGGSCPFPLRCFAIGTGCFGEPEPCRCHSSTTTCPTSTSTSSTTSTTVP